MVNKFIAKNFGLVGIVLFDKAIKGETISSDFKEFEEYGISYTKVRSVFNKMIKSCIIKAEPKRISYKKYWVLKNILEV